MSRQGTPGWWPRWRRLKDQLATAVITGGGGVVLMTIVMLFAFLIYEIAPLLEPANLAERGRIDWRSPGDPDPVLLSTGEYGAVSFSIDRSGRAEFLRTSDGAALSSIDLAAGSPLTAMAEAAPGETGIALGFADGSVMLLRQDYRYEFAEGYRKAIPSLIYPLGDLPLQGARRLPVASLALGRDNGLLAVQYRDGSLFLLPLTAEHAAGALPAGVDMGVWPPAAGLHIGGDNRWLLLLEENGNYQLWMLEGGPPYQRATGSLFADDASLDASLLLQGAQSLIAASDQGKLVQYFVRRDAGAPAVVPVRAFDTAGERIHLLVAEHRRRGFMAFSNQSLQWFNATAGKRSVRAPLDATPPRAVAVSPRADMLLLAAGDGELRRWELRNPHPEVSLSSLWRETWYEGYAEPALVYQSSASSNDYESKYSLTPLAFGTVKAAFYTMLFAAPLAVGGAIYTAFFMAPALRRRIKPTIELMEALPTVILGFLAGLWLAPYVEDNLGAILALVFTLPAGVLLFALLWSRLPLSWQIALPAGWHPVVLTPVFLCLAWLGLSLGEPLELLLFGGDAQRWLSEELGLAYDQRNAMVVGIAMGFAVIPTIFSIAEDAIYSVPRHISNGSMALGATPWQTLMGVVLPTASPGVFSAVMIGFGRAVGETMIVLMATGNTPITDFNLLEGMRTLAANIAIEVPEAEVDSTHYRILFLAAFVLFLFTFAVNTLAEVVRQRLRARYGAMG